MGCGGKPHKKTAAEDKPVSWKQVGKEVKEVPGSFVEGGAEMVSRVPGYASSAAKSLKDLSPEAKAAILAGTGLYATHKAVKGAKGAARALSRPKVTEPGVISKIIKKFITRGRG